MKVNHKLMSLGISLLHTVRRIYTKQCSLILSFCIYIYLYNHSCFCIHILLVQQLTRKLYAAMSKMVPMSIFGGDSYSLSRVCHQQYPAWKAALFMCYFYAEELGGISLMDCPFLVQIFSCCIYTQALIAFNKQ